MTLILNNRKKKPVQPVCCDSVLLTIQRATCDILPDLVLNFFTFIYKFVFVNKNVSHGFIKLMCNHDFSRVSFAAELSTKLVYNSVFVKGFDYIFCICYLYIYIYIYI